MFIYLARLACHLSTTFFFFFPFLWAPLRANNNGQCKRVIVIVQKMENKTTSERNTSLQAYLSSCYLYPQMNISMSVI